MRWPGAGGDPSPSLPGLENGEVLMGGSKVMWLSASPPHREAKEEKLRLPTCLSKISLSTAEGWR